MLTPRGFDVAVLKNSMDRADHSPFLGAGSPGQSLRGSSLCSTVWLRLSRPPGQSLHRYLSEAQERGCRWECYKLTNPGNTTLKFLRVQ